MGKALFNRKTPALGERGIHLDLKGNPPTAHRLRQLVELCGAVRASCVLMEWEDTYSWSTYPELRAPWAYDDRQVSSIIRTAQEAGVEVIPLVQCLGHMETVLLKNRFRHLREVDDLPSVMCPMNEEGRDVVKAMIDDVLRLHGPVRRLHLGGDEVWTLGSCRRCKAYAARHGKPALYLQHILPLLEYLNGKGVRPILWDDMMRDWPLKSLKRLAKAADLMVWRYEPDPWQHLPETLLQRYERAGISLWGASCFRGGEGPSGFFGQMDERVANVLEWVNRAKAEPFLGVMATGWARFGTCMVQMETLETSLSKLVLAAAAAWDGSLPSNYEAQAERFLTSGPGEPWAGPRYRRCHAAGKALHDWHTSMTRSIEWAESLAMMSGEPGRRHERYGRADGLAEMLIEGKQKMDVFVRAHHGLVNDASLTYFRQSRLVPLQQRIISLGMELPEAALTSYAPPILHT